MPQRILSEDWEDYDNRKIRDSRDSRYFSCEEPWGSRLSGQENQKTQRQYGTRN